MTDLQPIQLAPELIDVGRGIVNAMNNAGILDFSDTLKQVKPDFIPPTGTVVNLSYLLQQVIPNYQALQYYPGHPLETLRAIGLKDQSANFAIKYSKFPAIMFFFDVAESKNSIGWAYQVNGLQIVIACHTSAEYTTEQRHVNNFVPILLPIYRELLMQLAAAKVIGNDIATKIRHDKINRYFWGREGLYGVEGNIFNDKLDCIEIRNLQLNLNNLNC